MFRPSWDYRSLDIVEIRHRIQLSLTTSPFAFWNSASEPMAHIGLGPAPTGYPTRHSVSQLWNVFRSRPGIRFSPAPSIDPGRLPAGLDDVSTSEEHAAVTLRGAAPSFSVDTRNEAAKMGHGIGRLALGRIRDRHAEEARK